MKWAWPLYPVLLLSVSMAVEAPPRVTLAPENQSPDGRFGILEVQGQTTKGEEFDVWGNVSLFRLANHKPALDLTLDTGNPQWGPVTACWSADSRICICSQPAKWGPWDVLGVEVHRDGSTTQRSLLKPLEKEILSRLQKVFPHEYAAVKKKQTDPLSAYPDGFAFDVTFFPDPSRKGVANFVAGVTADPKWPYGIDWREHKDEQLQACLEGRISTGLKISVSTFGAYGPDDLMEMKRQMEALSQAEKERFQSLLKKLEGSDSSRLTDDENAWKASQEAEDKLEQYSLCTGAEWERKVVAIGAHLNLLGQQLSDLKKAGK